MDYSYLSSVSLDYHNTDVIMSATASQITSLTIVYSTVYSDADQRKHQSSASLAFVRGINRAPVNSPHKWLVTRKMFPFDDVIMALDFVVAKSASTEALITHVNSVRHSNQYFDVQSRSLIFMFFQKEIYFIRKHHCASRSFHGYRLLYHLG